MANAEELIGKVFRNQRQFELKIVRRIIPDLSAFEETF